MLDCISVQNMRESDSYTIANFVSSLALMHRAAYGVYLSGQWQGSTATVVGSGNNGGDGYALSCILAENGLNCTVFTVSQKLSADGAHYCAKAKELNVPISSSVCPTVKLIGTRRTLGRCCAKGSRKKYTEYDYYIEISRNTLNNPEKSIRNTIIHELLHTVPDGMRHTGAWKKWAKYVSQKTGHTIQRLAENKNE